MPNYKYIVVNKDNKQLIGKIEADNESQARDELNELGFSIITLEKLEAEDKKKNGKSFEFEGIDKKNKHIKGTINSESRFKAFERLLKEYELDISYLIEEGLSEEEKEAQKKIGVSDLLKEYQTVVQKKMKLYHEEKIKTIDRNFEKRKALIMRQIDFILTKVNIFIEKYKGEVNPQDLQQIKSFINKILRLKNTTNLNYLKKTCKSLLKFLQDAEIFLHKKKRLKDKAKLFTDAQDMIQHLDKGKDFGIYEDLEDQIKRWQHENITGKKKIPIPKLIKNFYYTFVLSIIEEKPEIKQIKKKLYNINNELKQYYTLIIKTKDKSYKEAAKNSINKLKEQRKKLKVELKQIRSKLKDTEEIGLFEKTIYGITKISGYVLVLCMFYYFISLYISTKELFFQTSPLSLEVEKLSSFKHLFGASFLIYILFAIKLNFFKKNSIASIVIIPILIVSLSIMVFNF